MSDEITIQVEGDEGEVTSKPRAESIEDIQRRGDQALAEAARAKHETAHHRATIARTRVGTALVKADSEAQSAAAEYRLALEAGDMDAQVGAQARMAEVEARRVRLQEHAEAIERSPVLQHDDPVEALCATRTEPTARWLREHRDWVVDPKKNAKLTAAHFDAVADGLREDTVEYFSAIERRIGLSDGTKGVRSDGERSGERLPPKIDPNNPGTHVTGGGSKVFLTRGERQAAEDGQTHVWGRHDLAAGRIRDPSLVGKAIGIREMARRKSEMVRQGWYNRLES